MLLNNHTILIKNNHIDNVKFLNLYTLQYIHITLITRLMNIFLTVLGYKLLIELKGFKTSLWTQSLYKMKINYKTIRSTHLCNQYVNCYYYRVIILLLALKCYV